MKVYIEGDSHLTHYTKIGAAYRGLHVTNEWSDADLILIAQDTPTDSEGIRYLSSIEMMTRYYCEIGKPVILMSQVPPGFCRKQNMPNLYHYPETLRIKDSYERACNPEYIVCGKHDKFQVPEPPVYDFGHSFGCRFFEVDYETAEMCKIAVNTVLASQVDTANRLSSTCEKVGANWDHIARIISHDKRIGEHAYLTPGRWQDSLHLLRDYVTLKEIEDAR